MSNLAGDVTGAPGSNSVAFVGGKSAASVAATVTDVAAATNANVGSAIVRRDGGGNFAAANITASGFVMVNSTAKMQNTTAGFFAGPNAGNVSGTGGTNIGIGSGVLALLTTGSANVGVGNTALGNATTGGFNIAVGDAALANANGNRNVGIGHNAGSALSAGAQNIFIGYSAGELTESTNQTAIGAFALSKHPAGVANTVVGALSAMNLTTGDNNTLVGNGTANATTTGSGNTMVGSLAGNNLATGDRNTLVGFNAGLNLTSGSDNVYLGRVLGVASESATIRIGSNQTSAFMAGIFNQTAPSGTAVFIDNTGKLGTITSSRRYKRDIRPIDGDVLMRLRPVTFRYNEDLDPAGELQYGLIAEEVADVDPSLVLFDADGKPQTVRYQFLAPLLLNEVQQQRKTIEQQQALINELLQRVERLETQQR